MLLEIYNKEIKLNSLHVLEINNDIFQLLINYIGFDSRCQVFEYKDDSLLVLHGYHIYRNPIENIIEAIKGLFEELDFDDYELIDKRGDVSC